MTYLRAKTANIWIPARTLMIVLCAILTLASCAPGNTEIWELQSNDSTERAAHVVAVRRAALEVGFVANYPTNAPDRALGEYFAHEHLDRLNLAIIYNHQESHAQVKLLELGHKEQTPEAAIYVGELLRRFTQLVGPNKIIKLHSVQ